MNHISSSFMISFTSCMNSAMLEQAKYTAVSSAKILILILSGRELHFAKSLIYRINKRGPRTDPWGTPQFMDLRVDL